MSISHLPVFNVALDYGERNLQRTSNLLILIVKSLLHTHLVYPNRQTLLVNKGALDKEETFFIPMWRSSRQFIKLYLKYIRLAGKYIRDQEHGSINCAITYGGEKLVTNDLTPSEQVDVQQKFQFSTLEMEDSLRIELLQSKRRRYSKKRLMFGATLTLNDLKPNVLNELRIYPSKEEEESFICLSIYRNEDPMIFAVGSCPFTAHLDSRPVSPTKEYLDGMSWENIRFAWRKFRKTSIAEAESGGFDQLMDTLDEMNTVEIADPPLERVSTFDEYKQRSEDELEIVGSRQKTELNLDDPQGHWNTFFGDVIKAHFHYNGPLLGFTAEPLIGFEKGPPARLLIREQRILIIKGAGHRILSQFNLCRPLTLALRRTKTDISIIGLHQDSRVIKFTMDNLIIGEFLSFLLQYQPETVLMDDADGFRAIKHITMGQKDFIFLETEGSRALLLQIDECNVSKIRESMLTFRNEPSFWDLLFKTGESEPQDICINQEFDCFYKRLVPIPVRVTLLEHGILIRDRVAGVRWYISCMEISAAAPMKRLAVLGISIKTIRDVTLDLIRMSHLQMHMVLDWINSKEMCQTSCCI